MAQRPSCEHRSRAGGANAIDAALARKLLELALAAGGDYADLYFEYRAGADYVLEEEQRRSASAAASRSASACASPRATPPATRTARSSTGRRWRTRRAPPAQIAQAAASRRRRSSIARVADPELLPGAVPSLDVAARRTSSSCSAPRRSRRRARSTRASSRCEASFAEELKEILLVTSDGRMARDVQPLMRFGVRAIAERRRQAAGRLGRRRRPLRHGLLRRRIRPRRTAREAARVGDRDARRARRAGRRDGGRARPRRLRHPPARGGRPRPRGRLQPQGDVELLGPDRQARRVASCAPSSTTARSRTRAARSTSTTRATPAAHERAHRERHAARLHARPAVARSTSASSRPATAGASRSAAMPLPRMTNTVAARPAPHDPEEIIKSVKRGIYAKRFSRRSGQHLERRLRVLADRELPHRGRQAHRAAQGREPDRQRPRRAAPRSTCSATTSSSPTASGPAARTARSVPVGVGTPTVKIAAITVGGTKA